MSELVDHLADLTGFRDRDVMDVTLVVALREILEPTSVAIYRQVGEGTERRWLTRAKMQAGDDTATTDPTWANLDLLPRLDEYPERVQCMDGQAVMLSKAQVGLTLFPVATDVEVVGVLEIVSDTPLGISAQRQVSSILRIYRNFQGLLDYSERDTLTGLLNRKTFDESFLKLTSRPRVTGVEPQADEGRRQVGAQARYWLGVIDIDHFKSVNDNFGHLIGDEVLLLLSRLMRSSFRYNDRLYRFGGEEFVVLMLADGETGAWQAFERLRANTERYPFPQVGRISVSIGFTDIKPGDSPSSAFERADKAVYFAKTHGRNQVHCHATLVEAGHFVEETIVGDMELF